MALTPLVPKQPLLPLPPRGPRGPAGADGAGPFGKPYFILGTGQSNSVGYDGDYVLESNCHVWNNTNGADGDVGTAFSSATRAKTDPFVVYANLMAKANPTRRVYLLNVSIGGVGILQWLPGASSPNDMYQNIVDNITPALIAAGVDTIDELLWFQGEANVSVPTLHVEDFNAVIAGFRATDWYPYSTPVTVFAIAPQAISGVVGTDVMNNYLRSCVDSEQSLRRFVETYLLDATYWRDNLHLSALGYELAGTMAFSGRITGGPAKTCPEANVSLKSQILQYNGSFDWSQINGTSAVAVDGSFVVDGWIAEKNGTLTATAKQISTSDIPGFKNALELTITTAQGSLGSGDFLRMSMPLDGLSTFRLRWGTPEAYPLATGVFVKSSATGTFACRLAKFDDSESIFRMFTITAANTWQWIPLTFSGHYTTGLGAIANPVLRFDVILAAGSSFHGTEGAWVSASKLATSAQTNFASSNSRTFAITGVAIVPGLFMPTQEYAAFLQRHENDELRILQRFYWNSPLITSPTINSTDSGFYQELRIDYPETMHATPTLYYFDDTGGASKVRYIDKDGALLSRAAAYTATTNRQAATISAYTASRAGFQTYVIADALLR